MLLIELIKSQNYLVACGHSQDNPDGESPLSCMPLVRQCCMQGRKQCGNYAMYAVMLDLLIVLADVVTHDRPRKQKHKYRAVQYHSGAVIKL